tara:strand:+ start:294 stop:1256 length:963 start_codon:yes stop_codon:yes gene_type:complete
MAAGDRVTNAFDTYASVGIREDLSKQIFDITPTDTPFLNGIGRRNVTNVGFDWLVDALPAAAANAQLEGEELSRAASTATTRHSNTCQISFKDATVTGTARKVNTAGRRDELAYQMAKAAKALKRDVEYTLLSNVAENAGNATTARTTGTMGAWVTTNSSVNTGSGSPTAAGTALNGNTIRTNASANRDISATLINAAMKLCYDNGAQPSKFFLTSSAKQTFSSLSGRSNDRYMQTKSTIDANVDVYVSDFGTLTAIPSRQNQAEDAWIIDPDFVSVAMLRPFQTQELGRIGDSDTRMILIEYGLEMKNEKAHGAIFDLN